MKIKYKFLNNEIIEIEVDDEIGKIIEDFDRLERNALRRYRYNERRLDINISHSDWLKHMEPGFDLVKQAYDEELSIAFDSLTHKQYELVEFIACSSGNKLKDYAARECVSTAAITNRKNRIKNKLKRFLKN